MPKWTKAEIAETAAHVQRIGEFRVHIKYGRGNENGNVVTARLWHPDGKIVGRATGGGYDMQGSALGDAIEIFFQTELTEWKDAGNGDMRKYGVHARQSTEPKEGYIVDGACGIEIMLSLLGALGFKARKFDTGKASCMVLAERVPKTDNVPTEFVGTNREWENA